MDSVSKLHTINFSYHYVPKILGIRTFPNADLSRDHRVQKISNVITYSTIIFNCHIYNSFARGPYNFGRDKSIEWGEVRAGFRLLPFQRANDDDGQDDTDNDGDEEQDEHFPAELGLVPCRLDQLLGPQLYVGRPCLYAALDCIWGWNSLIQQTITHPSAQFIEDILSNLCTKCILKYNIIIICCLFLYICMKYYGYV